MNLTLLDLLLIGILATYRLTNLLKAAQPGEAEEAGPGNILTRLRKRIGVTYDEHSRPIASNWRAEALLCFLCLSLWIGIGLGLLLAAAWLLGRVEIAIVLLLPFALSGGAIFLKKWAG